MISWIQSFLGKRLLKTGLAVFLTAVICQWLEWPVVFAVIAAIVTVEPTVHASIQKGKVRLPAAAIGAAIAMTFDFLFGQEPITFALSAFLTIYICHKLRWDDAILVATLTAIAMIPLTSENFLLAFLIRIATTSIGIVVSTVVNLIIWPPNFMKEIQEVSHELFSETIDLIEDTLNYQFKKDRNRQLLNIRFDRLSKGIERANETIRFQREDLRYRKKNIAHTKLLNDIELQIDLLHKVSFHIGDILAVSDQQTLPKEDKAILQTAWKLIKDSYEKRIIDQENEKTVRSLLYSLIYDHRDEKELLSKGTAIAYEILAMYHLLIEYEGRRKRQN
ncbi:aromatic acid exporter family protein [Alkalihalobacillus sp. BA299]|uniref:FUSC family protein n=1 Tax=Alkalihalobacillus sp. BA299 TaxID=2815938 RepID=UPI001ADC4D15|nr:aromatic acid exporter family protein [Alkalihalobacillus sp. BA299]